MYKLTDLPLKRFFTSKTIVYRWLGIIMILVSVAACSPAEPAQPLGPTPSPVVPTASLTFTPTVLPTLAPTVTPTAIPTEPPTPTLSPTPMPVMLTLEGNAVCRTGPGLRYDIETYIEKGKQVLAIGRLEGLEWWLIESDVPTDNPCWVSTLLVSHQGDTHQLPILTPPPLPTLPPKPTIESVGIVYYMLAENTGGLVGCGDSLIPIFTGISSTADFNNNIKTALNALFQHNAKYVDGLLNPIFASQLKAKKATLDAATKITTVQLAGTLSRPKDDCESKRMRAQVWYTIMQFPETGRPIVWLNNVLLGDLLVVTNK